MNQDIIERHHDELMEYWRSINCDCISQIASLRRLANGDNATSSDIRAVHNRFGWKAGVPVLCAGTIYRTEAFMRIPRECRDPSRPRGILMENWPRNIHLEHTIPIIQLYRKWVANRAGSPAAATRFFIENGITTAMSREEEIQIHGLSDYNTHPEPFLRYRSLAERGTVIWNLFTRERIDLATYDFGDHVETINALLAVSGAPSELIN